MAVDHSGNLYAAEDAGNSIVEYAAGTTQSIAYYSVGISTASVLLFDSSGDLFVANSGNSTVGEYPPGSVIPSVTYTATPNAVGGISIQSSNRPMQIGGSNLPGYNGIDLTTAELSRIVTTASGTLTLQDEENNITFTTVTPTTTPGASLNVVQDTTGSGQIILDDGAGTATALNGNGGSISITAGNGGIVALAANNNSAEIATTGASVTLLTAGPIGSSTNRIQFADDASTSQQVVSIGSSTIQPSSVYLDGLGSLTLGSILGGTTNAKVDVTARTNLTVTAGSTISSGTSTLSLGADLTAGELGDDGVGTLSIGAGATVTSANNTPHAVTLRGANVNLDTSSNPAVVSTQRVVSPRQEEPSPDWSTPAPWRSTRMGTCSSRIGDRTP